MSDTDYPKLRNIEFVPANVRGKQGLVLSDPLRYSDRVLFIPRELALIIQFFDGTKSLTDIQQEIANLSGSHIATEDIRRIADELDKSSYLLTESFLKLKRRIDEDFFRSEIRLPVHVGAGYHADPVMLREELGSYFAGIGDTKSGAPVPFREDGVLSAFIAPHISISAGGTCFASAYDAVRKAGPADLYVILGVGHAGVEHLFAGTTKDFMTPLGRVTTDRDFMEDLDRRYEGRLFAGEGLHRTEHTIEFQTVFLKYVFEDKPFTIAPILVSFPHTIFVHERLSEIRVMFDDFIRVLREKITEYPGRVVLVASVDFAHVGTKYGDEEAPDSAAIERVRRRDREMIEIIAAGDAERFLSHICEDDDARRICGFPAIYTMLSVMSGKKGRLLEYNSTVMDEENSTVTFASMVFGSA